jgi:plastocyanin
MLRDIHVPNGLVLGLAVIALAISSVALGAVMLGRSAPGGNAGNGGMMGGNGAGMMGGVSASSPSTITVARGETVTFVVTTMGPLVHEFMVGPADLVAANRQGTPEVADIGMMQAKSLTYTFDGSGPYAYACHADSHYEAGMRGTITVVG